MPAHGFSVILVPTAYPDPPPEALATARALARQGARLIVAHVAAGPVPPGAGRPCACACAGGPELGLRVEHTARPGPAADAILALAEERGCELIVIGDHAEPPAGGEPLLGGPVAQDVLRRAACPVVCLPAVGEPAGR